MYIRIQGVNLERTLNSSKTNSKIAETPVSTFYITGKDPPPHPKSYNMAGFILNLISLGRPCEC